ncbi:hypothetical protein C8J57DRAFT_1706848 [Mycena rebaudengoi]|nr:hypothetical protein C8J57DRAFT_1706848 [Mycena rebaudengoi]
MRKNNTKTTLVVLVPPLTGARFDRLLRPFRLLFFLIPLGFSCFQIVFSRFEHALHDGLAIQHAFMAPFSPPLLFSPRGCNYRLEIAPTELIPLPPGLGVLA